VYENITLLHQGNLGHLKYTARLGTGDSSKRSTHRSAQLVLRRRIAGVLSRWGYHVIKRKAWSLTMTGYVFGECHIPYTLTRSFIHVYLKRSRLIVTATIGKHCSPLSNSSYTFAVAVKSSCPECQFPPWFLNIVLYIVVIIISKEKFKWWWSTISSI
jgi:hypothetical protein